MTCSASLTLFGFHGHRCLSSNNPASTRRQRGTFLSLSPHLVSLCVWLSHYVVKHDYEFGISRTANEGAQFGFANAHKIGVLFPLEHIVHSVHALTSKTVLKFASLSLSVFFRGTYTRPFRVFRCRYQQKTNVVWGKSSGVVCKSHLL